MFSRYHIAPLLAALVTAGCGSTLPMDGPHHWQVDQFATASLEQPREKARKAAAPYVVVDVTPEIFRCLQDGGPGAFNTTFGVGKARAPEIKVSVGDSISVSIFESSAGGLFSPGEIGVRPGNFVNLPIQQVDHVGNITVPYAGVLRAAGRSVRDIQRDIEQRLASRAIEPQVVISLPEQSSSEVAIFGDAANASQKVRIRNGGERVLDVVARAGLRFPGHEVFVTLQRGEKRATLYLPTLLSAHHENVFMKPGDLLYLARDPQKYIAVGALGSASQSQGITGLFTFDSAKLSAAEAIAKAGGLLDTKANARSVFLYRTENRSTLHCLDVDVDRINADNGQIPTIYRFNYRDPSVFFVADKFLMRNRDIIYVSNADSVELEKFFGFVRLITGSVAGVATDITTTRNAFRGVSGTGN